MDERVERRAGREHPHLVNDVREKMMRWSRGTAVVMATGAALLLYGQAVAAQQRVYINPPGLTRPSGYTHVIVAPDGITVHIAGQVPLDSLGRIVGPGDFRAQVERVYQNVAVAIQSVGGSMSDLVSTTTFVKDMANMPILRDVRTRYLDAARPPTNTVVGVATLTRPELQVEISAIAILAKPYRPQ